VQKELQLKQKLVSYIVKFVWLHNRLGNETG